MGISIRGLTRGVMGGITAYRRGALQGQEQNRELAAAEQARQRQKEQDEQTALYREVESNLANRRLDIDERRAKAYEMGQTPKSLTDKVAEAEALAAARRRGAPPVRRTGSGSTADPAAPLRSAARALMSYEVQGVRRQRPWAAAVALARQQYPRVSQTIVDQVIASPDSGTPAPAPQNDDDVALSRMAEAVRRAMQGR